MRLVSTSPAAMAMIRAPSLRASIRPLLKRWTTLRDGPAVLADPATGLPVRQASATAAQTPYSSWRTWMNSILPLR